MGHGIAIRLLVASIALQSILCATASHAEEAHHGTEVHPARHPYHTHMVGLFAGLATEDETVRENGFALGLEYEYRFSEGFGIGGVIEHTWGDLDTWVFVVPFAYHRGPWKLYAGPGIEDGEHGSENLIRLGAEYGFHFQEWEISPQVDLDIVDRETEVWVIGVVFSRGFGTRAAGK